MAKPTVKLNVDSEIVKPLVALCMEQTRLIMDLHERVHSTTLDNRVAEMFDKINRMQLNDVLRDIQREAFEAGFAASAQGFNGEHGATENCIDEAFNEWVM